MKTVFTNGCFDILHRGHIELLKQARKCGDQLIVGINSDSSVRRLKGQCRPVISQTDRAFILSELKCVDAVFIFEEDTPMDLIEKIRPDVLVKGGDWEEGEIVGEDFVKSYGGEVCRISYLKGYSTTNIIKRIEDLSL